ncbi:MAG: hypothetical protein EBX52_13110, partial [Proteobacteria bacterium]|nr:hypothetical protein [Pseudomonadota bacterium]
PDLLGKSLGELVVGLSAYREEGVKSGPLIFIAPDLGLLLAHIKGNNPIEIGSGILSPPLIRTMLKVCGPLACQHDWGIYLEVQGELTRYGIFRTDRFPLHESSFRRLRSLRIGTSEIIGLRRIGESIIEIRNSNGGCHYIDSSGLLEDSGNPSHRLELWVSAVTRDVESRLKKRMEDFYHRIAFEILSSPHGTLSAVVETNHPYPTFLKDGVVMNRDFGLASEIQNYLKERNEANALSLHCYSGLILKMLAMDGITVFNTSGDVLAFNCFVRSLNSHEPDRLILGGARKRAFEILNQHLGSDLACALYQSQDGWGQCTLAPPPGPAPV